jgi:hypothetical protein
MQHFAFGLHLPIDNLREFVVSGISHPVPLPTPETSRQFRLARISALQTAKLYAQEGFAVVIDDVIFPHDATQLETAFLTGFKLHKILLRPRLEVALERNATRSNKNFDTSFLEPVIRDLYANMNPEEYTNAGWKVIDSSDLSLESSAALILGSQI